MTKRYIFRLFLALLFFPTLAHSQASDLFISEYVEGNGNVKYLEIFNGTGSAVDLSDYEFLLFSNGSSTESGNSVKDLTGMLAPNAVFVFANSSAEVVYAGEKTVSNITFFNGDDALAIKKKSTGAYVDIFGQIGNDPGSAWTVGEITTANKTLIRKPDVKSGVTTNPTNGFPTLGTEWIMKDTDDISDLGKHTFDAVQNVGDSDAIFDPSFSFNQTVDPLAFTVGTTPLASGLEILRFIVRDGGEALADQDEVGTIINQLKFLVSGSTSVAQLGVFLDDVLVGSADVENPVVFVSLENVEVPDGEQKTFSVKLLLSAQVEDGVSLFVDLEQLTVTEASSGFIAHNSSLVTSNKDQPYNAIDVVATKLSFFGIPANNSTENAVSVSVEAQNETGSKDIDASGVVVLSLKTGESSLQFVNSSNASTNFSNGVAIWSIRYPSAETITVTATSANYGSADASVTFIEGSAGGDYETIAPGLLGTELITYLRNNYSVTNSLSYNSARDQIFMIIDNKRVNGEGASVNTLECVYTGRLTVGYSSRTDAQGANAANFNTEHTWPQGLFDSASPMVSDIHHLYPTDSGVNNSRGSLPFRNIADNSVTTWYRLDESRSTAPAVEVRGEYSKKASSSFEPRDVHKGNVARAMFYFWAMYGNRNNVADDASFFNGMKNDLLTWHRLDKSDAQEIKRSDTTKHFQGNRNPFVHDTSLVARAFFPETVVSVVDEPVRTFSFTLDQNYPNPFNPSTTIRFQLVKQGEVSLRVFDVLGKEVAILANQTYSSGAHELRFDASKLTSGVYFYQIRTPEGSLTKQMMLLK